ncbi:MAG: hypothetical protein AAB627_01745 [Patescibacteria group bacterium]
MKQITNLKEKLNKKIQMVNFRKMNLILLLFTLTLFSYYIYQAISISSGNVSLVNLKKKLLEIKNDLARISQSDNLENFNPDLIKESFKMAEIEKFDYIIVGPSEFVLIQGNSTNSQ